MFIVHQQEEFVSNFSQTPTSHPLRNTGSNVWKSLLNKFLIFALIILKIKNVIVSYWLVTTIFYRSIRHTKLPSKDNPFQPQFPRNWYCSPICELVTFLIPKSYKILIIFLTGARSHYYGNPHRKSITKFMVNLGMEGPTKKSDLPVHSWLTIEYPSTECVKDLD